MKERAPSFEILIKHKIELVVLFIMFKIRFKIMKISLGIEKLCKLRSYHCS